MELGTSIRTWLGLPPGPWPPDHYALLALPRGTGDFTEIESRVLDRMERLRQHQLLHPDAVTEGMNRLAQALVCLTDPVERAAYDRALGVAPAPFEVVEDEPQFAEEIAEPGAPTVVAFQPHLRPPGEAPQLPYEVIEDDDPTPLPYEVVPDDQVAEDLPPAYEVVPDPPEKPRAVPPPVPLKRRTIYRRLAALRRAIRAWEDLRPVFGTPDEALSTPVAVLMFLRAVTGARDALPGVAFALRGPRDAGGVVAALVRLPSVLSTVRGLLPSQRHAVALDWRRGYAALLNERDRLRELVFVARGRRRKRSELTRAVRRTPELVLVALAVILVITALVRRTH